MLKGKVFSHPNVLAVGKTLTHFRINAMLPHGQISLCERNVKNVIYVHSVQYCSRLQVT